MSVILENISKVFGSQKAVDQVSFEARKGEVLGFLGPNGAGKTTTMKMITCFLPQTSGRATVCGFDTLEQPIRVRERIGYLPEHNPLYKDMYVKEYLRFVAGLHRTKEVSKRVDEMVERTGLLKEQHKPIGALSKGYRQRVGLAQALLHDPDVLILDEPTSGLDPNQLAEIRRLIQDLGKEKTVIFSTHIMQEVQAICDRVIIINNGKLVADDPIDKLEKRISGESIVTISLKERVEEKDLKGIKGLNSLRKMDAHRWQLIADAEADLREPIFDFIVGKGWKLLEMHKEVYSVEDVFQRLTGEGVDV
jgi:ABC-2 type transport system ATP-binding protein